MLDGLTTILEPAGADALAWLVAMTLWTAGLFAAAWLANAVLARHVAARWRVLLFAAVLLRLALPADWGSPIGILVPERAAAPAFVGTVEVVRDASPAAPARLPLSQAVPPTATLAGTGVALAWALGALVLFAAGRIGRVRLARSLHSASRAELPPGVAAPPTPVLVHPSLGPAVVGVARPRIVLPERLLETLDASSLARVLRHEQAHVVRRDPWLALGLHLLLAVAWPVVPAWLACRWIRTLCEEAADERALRDADGRERRAYGLTLLDVARRASPRPRLAVGLLPFGSALTSRVRALRVERRWPVAAQAAIAVVAASVLVGAAAERDANAQPFEPRRVSLSASGTPLDATLLETLRTEAASALPLGASVERVAFDRGNGRIILVAEASTPSEVARLADALEESSLGAPEIVRVMAARPAGGDARRVRIVLTWHLPADASIEELSGRAWIEPWDGGEAFEAGEGEPIWHGDRVRVPEGAVRLTLRDGGDVALEGTVVIEPDAEVVSGPPAAPPPSSELLKAIERLAPPSVTLAGAKPARDGSLRVGLRAPSFDRADALIDALEAEGHPGPAEINVSPTDDGMVFVSLTFLPPLESQVRTIEHASLEAAKEVVDGLLSERGRCVVDREQQAVVYTEEPRRFAAIEAALDDLDVPRPEYVIEYRLFEVDGPAVGELGVSLDGRPAPQKFLRDDLEEIDRRAEDLEDRGALTVISRPVVVVKLGEAAKLETGGGAPHQPPHVRIVSRVEPTEDGGVDVSSTFELGDGTSGRFTAAADGGAHSMATPVEPGRWMVLFVAARESDS